MSSEIVGVALLILGLFQVVRADLMLAFEARLCDALGVHLAQCDRNKRIVRSIGVAVTILALLVLTQAIP